MAQTAQELMVSETTADASRRLLLEASRVRAGDRAHASLLLSEAAFAQAVGGDVRGSLRTARRATELGAGLDRACLAPAHVAHGWALVLSGYGRRGYALYREWLPVATRSSDPPTVTSPALAGQVAVWMEDYPVAEGRLAAGLPSTRGDRADLLACRAELAFRTGGWPVARSAALASAELASPVQLGRSWCELARLEAVAGESGSARAHAGRARAVASTDGLGLLAIDATAVLGLVDLSAGRPDAALRHFVHARALARRARLGEPNIVRWAPDLIEALVRTGQIVEGQRALQTLIVRAQRTNRVWTRAAAARHLGQFAAPGDVDSAFAQAELAQREVRSPFDRGRLDLCWGERLQRDGRRVEARARLRRARERFDAIGAGPWAEQADRAIRASGARAGDGLVTARQGLTRQERRVALLAADGLTNKEIAARLFVSAKTVEFHLGNVYRKLEVRSRTKLACMISSKLTPSPPSQGRGRETTAG